MKHILFGLAAVLFASSVALADDQLTAQVKPASAEAAQPSAPVPAKVPSGADADVHTANSESAASAEKPAPTGERGIGAFSLGMSEDEAKALGAKPTDNADMLQLPFKWMEADWTCVVQFQEGKAVAVILYANMSDPLLARVFDDLRAQDCMPITVQPAMGHADLYQLAAQGKSDGRPCASASMSFPPPLRGPVPSCSRRRAFSRRLPPPSKILPKRKPSSLNIPPLPFMP